MINSSRLSFCSGFQAKCERGDGLRVPLEDVRRHASLLRQNQRGERQEQLCPHLRTLGRTSGLWLPTGSINLSLDVKTKL